MRRILTSLTTAACLGLILGITAQAQDKKVDPTGTWKWSQAGRQGGNPVEMTLKLKLEGEKLTGSVTRPGRQGGDPQETAIENAKLKGDEVSFEVTREFQGNKFTTKYNGKISGDTIKGTTERPGRDGGDPRKDPWEAKREKAK